MNKKSMLGVLATLSLASLAFAAVEAQAADTSTHMGTGGSISFYETNRPTPGPFVGNLTFAWAPNEFNFGNNKVDSSHKTAAKTYRQKETANQQYLSVSDDRDEKGVWQVKANLEDFVDTSDNTNMLDNAELTLMFGKLEEYKIDLEKSDELGVATPNIIEDTARGDLAAATAAHFTTPALDKPLKLIAGSGSEQIIVYDNADVAAASVAVATAISDVRLKVLDHTDTTDKSFTSRLHWNITNDVTP